MATEEKPPRQAKRSRAAVFQATGVEETPADAQHREYSQPPQVLLVPHHVRGLVRDNLPRNGVAGDLFAAIPSRPNPNRLRGPRAELWFCTLTGSDDPSQPGAEWCRVHFEDRVVVG